MPLVVYPVVVKTYWCYSLQKFIYNFVTIYDIATKFGIRMCPYPSSLCTKFLQLDNGFVFYDIFHTLKKPKKLSQFSKVYISETPGKI